MSLLPDIAALLNIGIPANGVQMVVSYQTIASTCIMQNVNIMLLWCFCMNTEAWLIQGLPMHLLVTMGTSKCQTCKGVTSFRLTLPITAGHNQLTITCFLSTH